MPSTWDDPKISSVFSDFGEATRGAPAEAGAESPWKWGTTDRFELGQSIEHHGTSEIVWGNAPVKSVS